MRNAERKAVDQPARLHPNSRSSVEVRLLECSERGFRARAELRLNRRDEVTLELPGVGAAPAYVIWVRGEEFGAEFVRPIPVEQAELVPAGDQERLARLLVQRAAARMSGHWEHEERLRREISGALPVRRG